MTTTVNPTYGYDDRCFVAKSKLTPHCFELRIGSNPLTTSYDLALCNLTVIFTDSCCLNTVGNNTISSIILRIPLTFAHGCFSYRINILTANGILNNVTIIVGAESFPLTYYTLDGYLNIVIPVEAIGQSQNDDGNCVATLTFDRFSISLSRISSFNNCCPLCQSIEWVLGPQVTSGNGVSQLVQNNGTVDLTGTIDYPSGIRRVNYTIVGGGGGGGGGGNDNLNTGSGGGGGGSAFPVQNVYLNPFPYSPFSIYYTIGTGGTAGGASRLNGGGPGGAGTNTTIQLGSSIGVVIASSSGGTGGAGGSGGSGGVGGVGGANGGNGGSGGAGSNGSGPKMGSGGLYAFPIAGGGGGGGLNLTGTGGNGGSGGIPPSNGVSGAGGGGGTGIGNDFGETPQSGALGGGGYFLSVSS